MEPTVLSGPLGLTQTFPLGFQTLDPDNGAVLCPSQSGQTGLDFRNSDHQDQISSQNLDKSVFVDEPQHLDSLIDVSTFSCGDMQFNRDIKEIQELSCTEKINGLDEISDSTLSWLFSPNFPDVIGKNSACNEVTLTQDPSLEDSAELISLSVPSSPKKISEKDSEMNAGDEFLLDLFSSDQSSGEFYPQGVREEQGQQEEPVGLPVTVSAETGDKGLFPDQVTDPPDSSTLQSLPENCLPHNHISSSLECSEGSVPLLDLSVADFDSCLSLCPASPASVICTGTLLDTPREESEVLHAEASVITNPTSENQGENNSHAPGLSDEPSSLTLPLAEDSLNQDDPTSRSNSEEGVSENLIGATINQGSKDMALDLCLTVEEVHDEEPWDLKPQEESAPDPTAEPIEEKRPAETNQPEGPDCHQVPPFEYSVQDVNASSPETGWTSEQAVETISLSKMVVDDSLPMVSAESTREEDVSPLKAVFDALDQDGDGFVRIEEFMEFAAAYGADQVRCLVFLPRQRLQCNTC